jgi:DNA-binding NarL/FixJ family response regulator
MMVVHERGVLSDMVREVLEADASIEVRGELLEGSHVPEAVERANPDVVVWLARDPRSTGEGVRAILDRSPRLRVLAVKDGRRAWLWRMRPHVRTLGELSLDRLLEEVRGRA